MNLSVPMLCGPDKITVDTVTRSISASIKNNTCVLHDSKVCKGPLIMAVSLTDSLAVISIEFRTPEGKVELGDKYLVKSGISSIVRSYILNSLPEDYRNIPDQEYLVISGIAFALSRSVVAYIVDVENAHLYSCQVNNLVRCKTIDIHSSIVNSLQFSTAINVIDSIVRSAANTQFGGISRTRITSSRGCHFSKKDMQSVITLTGANLKEI